jgi:hypothetical protein
MAGRFVNGSPNDVNNYRYYTILNDGEDAETVANTLAPTDCATGSTLYFINTGDVFMFYSVNKKWYRQ